MSWSSEIWIYFLNADCKPMENNMVSTRINFILHIMRTTFLLFVFKKVRECMIDLLCFSHSHALRIIHHWCIQSHLIKCNFTYGKSNALFNNMQRMSFRYMWIKIIPLNCWQMGSNVWKYFSCSRKQGQVFKNSSNAGQSKSIIFLLVVL